MNRNTPGFHPFATTLACGLLLAALLPRDAAAYPEKAIRLIVPYPAGTVTDFVGRPIAAKLAEAWRQPVVVDNRPGATGNVGAEVVAKSAPDGYTLLLGSPPPNVVNASLSRKMPYDPLRDFEPITLIATTHQLLVVHPSVPAKSVKELIALSKSRPGQLNYGSSGNGSTPHLTTELFKFMTGADLVHVPYKGSPQYTIDIVAGRIDVVFSAIGGALPHVKSGKLRLLGITAPTRDPTMPEVPTIDEAGVPGFDMRSWYGIFAAAGTPPAIVDKLHGEIVRIVALPDVKAQYAGAGLTSTSSTPAELGALVKREFAKWAKVIKAVGIRLD